MGNEFVFHGIGQGLFYSGSISDGAFNFVYDCGTSTTKSKIVNDINALPDEIDFLVISHLHDDHVNYLPTLLKNKKIKKIFLPYFDVTTYKDVFIAYLIGNGIYPNKDGTFETILKLYGCDLNLEMGALFEIGDIQREMISNDLVSHQILIKHIWEFCLFNKKVDVVIFLQLKSSLNLLLNGNSIENYLKDNSNNYKEIAKEFKRIFGNLNLSSLVLLHYGNEQSQRKTLLTGDIVFDDDLERRVMSKISNNDELILQVPHHGATHEWDKVPQCIVDRSKDVVLSFGISNSYHHPSNKIICKYYGNNQLDRLKFVCENLDFKYTI